MIWSLLADAADATEQPAGQNWLFYGLLIALVVLVVVWLVFSSRKNKARDKEYIEQLDAIKPGHKVKSTGGLCGIVAEVCDDNTIIVETGSEETGKSYFKLAKECIYQTDAKGPTQIAREEAEARRKAEKEAKKNGEAPAAQPETPAEEAAAPAEAEENKE